MSALLKVLRESAMSWEDIGGEGGRWTASSLFLSEEAINQVKDSFEVGRVFRGKTIYSYTEGDTSYRVFVS